MKSRDRFLVRLFGVMLLAVLTFSCKATTQKVIPCAANAVQIDQVYQALNNPDQAAALAAVDALSFAWCVASSAVDGIIHALEPTPDSGVQAIAAADYSPVLANAKAWKAKHP